MADDLEDDVADDSDFDLDTEDDAEVGDEDADLEASDDTDVEDDDGEEEDDEPAPKAKKEGRYAVLARRAKEAEAEAKAAKEEVARIARQNDEALRQRNQAEWEKQEREKLENMLPEERIAYQTDQKLRQMQHTLARVEFQALEATEKAEFSAEARVNPVYAKYSARVEAMKQDFLKKGSNVSRENILKHLIGEDALKRGAKAGAKQRSSGTARKAAASGRQQGGRSDTVSNSKREKTLEERLENVLI